MSVGKESLKRAASAATTKSEKTTGTKAAGKKVATKKAETLAESKEVTAVVNSKTSEEVKETFAPKERVSHVSEELPVYLL